jgi:serine/threonine-protein kinase
MANAPCTYCGSTAGPEHPCPGKLIGKVLDGRYQIEAVVGQGGMGMVFRATQVAMKRPVAIKTLHPSLAAAPQFFERFRREAEVASRLNHPNIITVFDFGRAEDGTCYFVMELVQGESLKQLVKREGPLPLRRAVSIIEQAARGLHHAHQENVVHRDIKPHNFLISQVDGNDYVKLLDFGLVKALEIEEEEQLTSTGQVLGTPQYMPPEQAGGEEVDARSDLYSLSGVLYFCLTGASPFGANTVRKALTAALTQPIPSVNGKRQGAPVPRALDELFRQGLAADKDKRHQSAEEFIRAVRDAVSGCSDAELDAVPARPEGAAAGDGKPGRTPASHPSKASSKSKPPSSSKPSSASAPRAGSRPSNIVVDPAAAGSSPRARVTSPEVPSLKSATPPPAEPRSRGGKLAIVAGAAVLFAAGAAVVVGLRKPEPAAVERADARPAAPAEVKPAAHVEAKPAEVSPGEQNVTVKVHSVPVGAQVFVGEERRGSTPIELSLTRGRVHQITLKREGFVPASQPVDLVQYPGPVKNVDFSLEPVRAPAKPPPPKKPKKGEDIPVFE